MQWENLTVPAFAEAVESTGGVVVLPIGVLEPHASHLPLGVDIFTPHWAAVQAAKEEPVIVYRPYEFGINHDAAHLPGAIVFKRDLCFQMLEALCDEFGRNGLRKIILLNGHGGNLQFLQLFAKTVVERQPDYLVYHARIPFWRDYEHLMDDHEHGHACEVETSTALHVFPEHVKMDELPPEPFRRRDGLQALDDAGAYTFYQWHAAYPTMYVGDASTATAEKGRAVMENHVADLVKVIRAVKADETLPGMQTAFYDRWRQPRSAY
jgi:creatinine amidohydrolase